MSNVNAASELYRAMSAADVEAIILAIDPEVAWSEAQGHPYAADGVPFQGIDALFSDLFVKFLTEWEGFTMETTSMLDAGDVIVVEGRYHGTYLANGRVIDAPFAHVTTWRDGRLIGLRQYTDTAQWQTVMSD